MVLTKIETKKIAVEVLYDVALKIVIDSQRASASFLQRKLRIGYSRAVKILDMLEAEGIISESLGIKPREVLKDIKYLKKVIKKGRKSKIKVTMKGLVKAAKELEKAAKELEKEEKELNVKRERFCILYASDKEFFGNGTQAYIEAYNIDVTRKGSYNAARVSAHHLLTNPNILKRLDEILEDSGLNIPFVDKQLKLLITQNAFFPSKLGAIREFNSMKGRHKPRVILFGNIKTDEELEKAKQKLAELESKEADRKSKD